MALVITTRQFEAWRLVFCVGCSQQEAAEVMGISQQAVNNLLHRLSAKMPSIIFTEKPHVGRIKRFTQYDSRHIVCKF